MCSGNRCGGELASERAQAVRKGRIPAHRFDGTVIGQLEEIAIGGIVEGLGRSACIGSRTSGREREGVRPEWHGIKPVWCNESGARFQHIRREVC